MVESDSELDLGDSDEEEEEIKLLDITNKSNKCKDVRQEDYQETDRDNKSYISKDKFKTTRKFDFSYLRTINEEEKRRR